MRYNVTVEQVTYTFNTTILLMRMIHRLGMGDEWDVVVNERKLLSLNHHSPETTISWVASRYIHRQHPRINQYHVMQAVRL